MTTAQLMRGHNDCHLVLESVYLLTLRIFFDFYPSAARPILRDNANRRSNRNAEHTIDAY